MSIYYGPLYNTRYSHGSLTGKGVAYDLWDRNIIRMCNCDNGYFGADCSLGIVLIFKCLIELFVLFCFFLQLCVPKAMIPKL